VADSFNLQDQPILVRTSDGYNIYRVFPNDISRIENSLYESYNHRLCETSYAPSAFLIPALDYLILQYAYSDYLQGSPHFPSFTAKPQVNLRREQLELFWRQIPIFPVDSPEYSTALPLKRLGKYLPTPKEPRD